MARITVASLQSRIAALEAQLLIANSVCAEQRETIARHEETIAAQDVRIDNAVAYFKAQRTTPVVVAAQPKVTPVPTVSTYRDSQGQTWERTRYSATRSIARRVEASAETTCA